MRRKNREIRGKSRKSRKIPENPGNPGKSENAGQRENEAVSAFGGDEIERPAKKRRKIEVLIWSFNPNFNRKDSSLGLYK